METVQTMNPFSLLGPMVDDSVIVATTTSTGTLPPTATGLLLPCSAGFIVK